MEWQFLKKGILRSISQFMIMFIMIIHSCFRNLERPFGVQRCFLSWSMYEVIMNNKALVLQRWFLFSQDADTPTHNCCTKSIIRKEWGPQSFCIRIKPCLLAWCAAISAYIRGHLILKGLMSVYWEFVSG